MWVRQPDGTVQWVPPASFSQAPVVPPGQYSSTVNGTRAPDGTVIPLAPFETNGRASQILAGRAAAASTSTTAASPAAAAGSTATSRQLQAPASTTGSPRTSRYSLSSDGKVRSLNGRRVDSLGNYAFGGGPSATGGVAPLPATTGGALGGFGDPLAPTSLGGFIGAAYGGYQGGGNVVGPTGYNAFQQYIPGYDQGVGSLYAQDDATFGRTLAIGRDAQFWAELQQQQAQFQQQLRETILNNRRSQLLANIGVSGRNSAPTSRVDIR